jgi:hypothetical protein
MMQTLQRSARIHVHFRLIVSGESVNFCFLVIDPYERVMKLAHSRSPAVIWDAEYDGLMASRRFASPRKHAMAREACLRALSHRACGV